MTNNENTAALLRQRLCIAQLMDAHPDAFAAASSGTAWKEFVQAGAPLTAEDRRAVDKALGMLSALFRTAQAASQDGKPTLGQVFAADRSGLASQVPPDAGFLKRFGDEDIQDDPEAMALARSVSIYRRAADEGLVQASALGEYVDAMLHDLPAQTSLALAVREAARSIAAIELEQLLCRPEDSAADSVAARAMEPAHA